MVRFGSYVLNYATGVTLHGREYDMTPHLGEHNGLTSSYYPPDQSDSVSELSIGGALERAAGRWSSKIALVDGDLQIPSREWTFASLLSESKQIAQVLLTKFSVGDHLAIWAPNSPEWVLVEFGAAFAGLTLVTVNPAYRSSELRFVLEQSQAVGVIVQRHHRDRSLFDEAVAVSERLDNIREVIAIDECLTAVPVEARQELPDVDPGSAAQIQYTSGTTGFPKGALLSHRGLVNNARFYASAIGARDDDVWVNPMPLFHTAGCGLVTLGALQTGGVHVIPPAFDAGAMLDLIEEFSGTVVLCVPTMLIRMAEMQIATPRDVSTWRLATVGGAPVPPELLTRAQRQLSVAVAIGFGQTEASPYISHTRPGETPMGWEYTVGRPLPQVEVRIVEPGTGQIVPIGEIGEVHTRSACVMIGYFNDPAATTAALSADGWLRTGDLGSLDANGYLNIRGRLKDLIIRGGENVYPREIEDALFEHADVGNVSVVGIPDADLGEIVAAFVVVAEGPTPDHAVLEKHCRTRLAHYKVPAIIEFVDTLPQTASGKIQKYALRESYIASTKP